MDRIDAYTHVLTEPFYDALTANADFQGLSGSPAWLWDIDRRLADMAALGIDMQVLTLALPQIWRGMDPDAALPLVRVANDELRRLADEHPEHFIPVGTLPFATEAYLAEFERCANDLGLAGVQIFSNVDGQPIDVAYDGVFERAAALDLPLWLHPQLHSWYEWTAEYMDHRLFGWPFDTTLALSRLVFSGLTQRFDFELIAHHGGGMIPFYGRRIDMFYRTREAYPENYDVELPVFEDGPTAHFRRFAADTALDGSAAALECAAKFFDADRLVFGTDYPFGPGRGRAKVDAMLEAINRADLPGTTAAKVFAGNLRSMVPTSGGG